MVNTLGQVGPLPFPKDKNRESNMTKAFDKIMAGLADALAYAKGDKTRGKAHEVPPQNNNSPNKEKNNNESQQGTKQ